MKIKKQSKHKLEKQNINYLFPSTGGISLIKSLYRTISVFILVVELHGLNNTH